MILKKSILNRRYDPRKQEWRPPKTNTSVRHIPIDSGTLLVLDRLKELKSLELKNNKIENLDQFIFYNSLDGVPSNYMVKKHLRDQIQILNIAPNDLSATGIRHTYASIVLSYGIDIWVIAANMGHKDITQITKTYGHLIKEKRKRRTIVSENY